jgi:hypothetical protein
VAEHPRGGAALQRRADAVRADVPLGVAEPGRQPDAVEVVLEAGVAGVAGEDDAVGVAEDDADGSAASWSAASRSTGRAARCSAESPSRSVP